MESLQEKSFKGTQCGTTPERLYVNCRVRTELHLPKKNTHTHTHTHTKIVPFMFMWVMMAVYCLDVVIPQAGTLQRLFKGFIQISSPLKHTFQSVLINYVLLTELLKYPLLNLLQ